VAVFTAAVAAADSTAVVVGALHTAVVVAVIEDLAVVTTIIVNLVAVIVDPVVAIHGVKFTAVAKDISSKTADLVVVMTIIADMRGVIVDPVVAIHGVKFTAVAKDISSKIEDLEVVMMIIVNLSAVIVDLGAAIAVMKLTAGAKDISAKSADIVRIDANSMIERQERAALTGGKRTPPVKDIKNISGVVDAAKAVGQVRERLLRRAHLGRRRNQRHTRRNLQREQGQTAEGRVT
jgi:hypothetical protein